MRGRDAESPLSSRDEPAPGWAAGHDAPVTRPPLEENDLVFTTQGGRPIAGSYIDIVGIMSAAPDRGQRVGIAWLAVAAIGALVVVIIAVNALRPSPEQPASIAASASPSATSSPTQQPVPSSAPPSSTPPSPAATASGSAVRPDSQHGLIVATGNMRTEDDPRGLQQPSLFMLAPTSSIGVSPDGKRIALIRTSQTGQQIVTFTTTRPNDVTTVVDLAGSGELANRVVWAGDGSDSLLFDAVKETRGPGGGDNLIWEYSVLRSVDLVKREVREVVRIAGQNTKLWPLAWLPARQLVGALELRQLGPVANYAVVRNGAIERTAMSPSPGVASFSASRDGLRIVVSIETSIRWWPVDQPSAAKELMAQPGERLGHAEFRPGADELGVGVAEGGASRSGHSPVRAGS